jgi:hypothetical protein
MSLSNLNELEDKVKELRNILVKEEGEYAFTCGYMESMFTRIINAYVPARRHHNVIDIIQAHIDGIKSNAE